MRNFKNPIAAGNSMIKPEYNKEAIVAYLKNFGDSQTDDAYEEWAKSKGKQINREPLNPNFIGTSYHKQFYGPDRKYTYSNQYLSDEDWLKEIWNDVAEDATEYYGTLGKGEK